MICGIIVVLLLGWYASYIFIFYSSFQKNTWGFVPEWEQASNLAKHRGLGQLRIAGTQGGRMEDEGNAWEAASFTWGGVGGKNRRIIRKSLHKDFKYREKELVLPMILCWFVGYWTAGAKNTADRFGLPTSIAHAPETGDWGKSALDIWKFATP